MIYGLDLNHTSIASHRLYIPRCLLAINFRPVNSIFLSSERFDTKRFRQRI